MTLQTPVRRAMTPNHAEQLEAALNWLRRLLIWQIGWTRRRYGELADDSYRGLYVPTAEVDLLGETEPELPPDLAAEYAAIGHQRDLIEEGALAAERAGSELPLRRLARLFALSSFEIDVLLLALAPELDLRFERIFAYIQDDVSRRRPSVDLALRLFCPTAATRLERQRAFEHDGPLLRQRLIQLFEDGQRRPPLLARFIKLDDRILAELRGGVPALDPQIVSCASLSLPARSLDDLLLPDELKRRLRRSGPDAALALQGGYGSGRRAVAEALCAEEGTPLLTVDLARLAEGEQATSTAAPPAEQMERIVREALLRGAAILWQRAGDLLASETQSGLRTTFLELLADHRGRSFLLLEQPWEANGTAIHSRYLRVELPELSFGEREQLWRLHLGAGTDEPGVARALASTFRLTGGQIRNAAAMARSLARWRSDGGAPSHHDLYAACRAQASGRLDALAHKIRPTYSWDDIVLPPDQLGQLREICLQVRHRQTVLERWGFDRHLAMGKGVNVLFAGSSGTGKTMAAEIIAGDLGLELYKIDLSAMVSKYIGETEKNLDKVFAAAREANAILFFDEADAIFGKRSEVKDAHDRYANIEVGYLLQKMEEYDGVVILATNLRKNLDEAFVRRLHTAIDFPFPEEPDRLRIWRKVFPAEAPLAAEVDLSFLAARFRLTGGNIRNAALLAAYLGAEEGERIGMAQIIRAVRREYQKIGKLATEAEFGPYLALARG